MFNLARHERFIVIFLVAFLMAGSAVFLYKKSTCAVKVDIGKFSREGNSEESPSYDSLHSSETVNVNTAGVEELMKLKGIGKTLAERIVEYRSTKGPFRIKDDIKNVKGIGESLFKRIKDDIVID